MVIGNGDYHPKKKVQRFKALFPRSAYVGHPIPAALFCVALGVPIILSDFRFPVCEMRVKIALNP